jgi:hypothetical protein
MSTQSHFFIESGVFAQTEGFGPVSASAFRLTSKFTITAPKKAFAICKGVVLVQPQTDNSTKVNLILRPFSQPFPGLNIKYFIYRGLQLTDFFTNASATAQIIQQSGATSDFINKINTDFTSFHGDRKDATGNPIPVPPFTAKFIGFDPAVPANTPLSSFFFKESKFVVAGNTFDEKDAFELPLIAMGKSLGNFATGDCGIDVVLNYGDYQHEFDNGEFVFDLEYARKAEAILTLAGTDGKKKLQREQTTQFIDIAAFYGLYTNEGKVTTDTAGTKTDKTGVAIYNEVLNNFVTKNNWYLYIQSDRTRSYDYYNKYKIASTANNIKTGLTETTMTDATYGTLGWPLLINTQTQSPVTPANTLLLQLVTDNNNNTALYKQIATLDKEHVRFYNANTLRLPADANGNYAQLTTPIKLTTPATPDGKNVATLNILLYQGIAYDYDAETLQDANGQTIIIKGQPNFFDDVFSLIKAKPLLLTNDGSDYAKMTSQKLNLINQYYDRRQQGVTVVQTLTVNDVIDTGTTAAPINRVTYVTETSDIQNNALSPTGGTTADTKTSTSASGTVAKSKTYALPEPYYYKLKLFTDSAQTITGLELKCTDGSTPSKIILGLTKTENDVIKALITAGLKNPRLFLIDLFDDDNQLLSPENIAYQKYKVGIVAENADGVLELYKPVTDVFVYSLDRKYHFSKGYSEFVKESSIESLSLDLDLALTIE